jgi:ABC-type glycerol-3-phosphate transport system substrate-binding protein
MAVSMIGCNNIGENQSDDGEAYTEQLVVSGWMQAPINRISFHNDVVYFTTYEETESAEGELCCNNRLYSVDSDGNNLKEISIDLTKEEPLTMITSIIISDDDTISIWLSSNDSLDTNQVNVFIKVDSTGKELMRKDLNSLVNGQYINKALETSQGQIVAMSEDNIYIFDESLELMNEIAIKGRVLGMALTKEEQILCATEDSDEKKFQIIDIEQGKVIETISLNKRESVDENAMLNGFQYDFCYRNEKGIYSYDIKNEKSTCLMSYEKTNLVSEDIVDGISVGMDDFMIINYPHDGTGCSIAIYKKPDETIDNNKTVITFGAFQFDVNMKRAVLDYNKTSTKYQITLKEYFDEDSEEITADEAIENLNEDIAKGTIPDILDLGILTEQYASKGLFEDLTAYIEKDEELSESLFIESVFNAMKQDDKLYYISPDFGIATLIGKAEYEKECNGWSVEKLAAFCEKQDDKMPFYAKTKIDLLDIVLQGSLSDFYDWKSVGCQFDSQEFIDILTFCNFAIQNDNSLESDMTRNEMIEQGKVLLLDESDFVPQEISSYRKLFGEEIAYIGYPNKEGQGSYFAFNNQIGIYSESNVKDGAWEFLRMLLSEEYQEQYADLSKGLDRIPIRKDCFDLLMNELSSPQEDTEESDDDILLPTEEEAFRNLVANTNKAVSYDIEMMQIIEEEAQSYFEGKKDVNEIVQIIQNRCTTYINEKR